MDNVNLLLKKWDANLERLHREDKEAKEQEKIVGRFIREQIADGYAYYKITKETKTSVTIEVVRNIGDDWQVPYWGDKTTIKKTYALMRLNQRDALSKIFG